ncbi:MAG: cation efflux protein, CzcI family [Roseateles sp.]|uniref:Cobalt-zinc-cadmium resistance protein n=1 Tax=Roseateles asaccharophilus TaxID=582607 RepID=A0ABU2AG57_9BURK|nr:hypothetical protein [Roseateles asaccharophilus]MDR7336195.1 hypothetical protein [Roseateles asaccharophilus]
MRKALVIFLLGLLSFQLVWGAAAGYCRHEQDVEVSHFGHHVHKHQTKAGSSPDGANSPVDNLNGEDADCMACHLCGPSLVGVVYDAPHPAGVSHAVASAEKDHSRLLIPAIYRPNWVAAS